jgi:prophage tail gpP-like protein
MATNNAANYNARALNNAVVLEIGGKSFTGWSSVSVNRSIDNVAGQFSLGIIKPVNLTVDSLTPGLPVRLTINGKPVVTGWLDDNQPEITSDDYSIQISGRDKTGDLVDCSAIYKGGMWSGRTLAQIAADLCQPFGITVLWQVTEASAGKPFGSFKLEHSETVYEALGRAARQRGVLMTSNATGDLVFTQAGTASAGSLEIGKTLAKLSGQNSWHNRFSLYRICGGHAAGGGLSDVMDVGQITGPQADVVDPEVTRYRPTIKIADHNITQQTAWARADHERRHAIAKSTRYDAEVIGWYQADGQLWDVNKIVNVTAAVLNMNAVPLLIAEVSYQLDDKGLTTKLTLAPREGYIVPVESDNKGSGTSAKYADVVGD